MELRSASHKLGGHSLALTLLGSNLSDAYPRNIRCRKAVSECFAYGVRQDILAQEVMRSYQTWLGEGLELSVLRLLGFFDRSADERAVEALLQPPVITGLTELLVGLTPAEWRAVLARLRRARLLTDEDPLQPRQLDAPPLVREYFGEQLRSQRAAAWKEGHRRLYEHYRTLAPPYQTVFGGTEPLFFGRRLKSHMR